MTNLEEKYQKLVAAGDQLIEAYKKHEKYNQEVDLGVLAGTGAGMSRQNAVDGFWETPRGVELVDLCRAARIDDQVARILYDRAYADLNVQLRLEAI